MRSRAILLTLTVGLLPSRGAMAQAGTPPDTTETREGVDPTRRDDEALAFRYAPTLHFAPQEQYFPILPFFNAFLKLSDTTPNLTPELAGKLEVMDGGRDSLILWNALADDYDSLQARDRQARHSKELLAVSGADSLEALLQRQPDTAIEASKAFQGALDSALSIQRQVSTQLSQAEWAPKVAALFYRVDHLTKGESRRIWARLRADFQLWARLMLPNRIRALADSSVNALPKLISLEYYAYYIRDLGLTGHAQDLEKFFVFIPEDSTPVQIMVGAAHSIVTPNNTVILARKQSQGSLLYTPHALVEYGGHSFSPDVAPTGSFTPGWDINWRASERSWGVRDIQAVLGTGFSGDYKVMYTLPRTDSLGVILKPLPPPSPSIGKPSSPPDSGRCALCCPVCARKGAQEERSYALIPIDTYRTLFDALESTEGGEPDRVARVRQVWDSVLGPVLQGMLGPVRQFPEDSAEAAEVYRRLRLWLKSDLAQQEEVRPGRPRKVSRLKGSGLKMRPWLSNEYIQAPEHIMKAWLYRPQDASRKCRLASFDFFPIHPADLQYLEFGFRYGIGKKFSHTGLVLEATDAYHCIERATKLNVPGTLSLGLAVSPFDISQGPVELLLRYQQRYFSPQTLTWSLGLSYVASFDSTESAEVGADPSRERSRFRVRPALVIMPIGLAKGATMEPNWGNLVLSSFAVRIGPQIDLFHPSRSMAWQIELAFRANPKFVPRGHRSSVHP
jgi:hypothetical protein